jgi:hypothetical protein
VPQLSAVCSTPLAPSVASQTDGADTEVVAPYYYGLIPVVSDDPHGQHLGWKSCKPKNSLKKLTIVI